jgi:DNA-binding LacI/PurR family transcriptional regulator
MIQVETRLRKGYMSAFMPSLDQPIEHMANAAVEMMVLRIENEHLPAEGRLFPGRLKSGSSEAG